MQYRAGIDIGGTKINIGLLDTDTRLLGNRVIPIAGDCDSRSVLRRAADALRQLCAEQGIVFEKIAVFGTASAAAGAGHRFGAFGKHAAYTGRPADHTQ